MPPTGEGSHAEGVPNVLLLSNADERLGASSVSYHQVRIYRYIQYIRSIYPVRGTFENCWDEKMPMHQQSICAHQRRYLMGIRSMVAGNVQITIHGSYSRPIRSSLIDQGALSFCYIRVGVTFSNPSKFKILISTALPKTAL